VAEGQRAIRHDEHPAHRVAHHPDAGIRNALARRRRLSAGGLDDVVDETPEDPRDDDEQDDEEQEANHHCPGCLIAGCADDRLSRARFAAWPSGLSGASLMTSCHAFDAPSRSCLPNALTMPTFRSVLACFGSILSDCSNCASALS